MNFCSVHNILNFNLIIYQTYLYIYIQFLIVYLTLRFNRWSTGWTSYLMTQLLDRANVRSGFNNYALKCSSRSNRKYLIRFKSCVLSLMLLIENIWLDIVLLEGVNMDFYTTSLLNLLSNF